MAGGLSLNIEQAQKILDRSPHLLIARTLEEALPSSSNTCTYILGVSKSENTPEAEWQSCFLVASRSIDSEPRSEYHTNSLRVVSRLLGLVHSKTSFPFNDVTFDASLVVVPFEFILTSPYSVPPSDLISLSEADLSVQQKALVDLKLGKGLAELHINVQNDWFGLPLASEPPEPSYSWQETFTILLEAFICQTEQSPSLLEEEEFPFQDLRLYLSRAIAYFLFDDVEVPSLILFTPDVYLSKSTLDIVAISPTLDRALWGDPLLETLFMLPNRSAALLEGYLGAGGENPLIFSRQNTKRLWYTAFLALAVLHEGMEMKKAWAVATLKKAVAELKDAPCY